MDDDPSAAASGKTDAESTEASHLADDPARPSNGASKGCLVVFLWSVMFFIALWAAVTIAVGFVYCSSSTGEFRYPVGQAALVGGVTVAVVALVVRSLGIRTLLVPHAAMFGRE